MEESDILFEDKDVCILKPDSKRGIVIFTRSNAENICEEGLLSFNELRKRHPELGLQNRRSKANSDPNHNNLIFFRAPYHKDTSSFESSYDGKTPEQMPSQESKVYVTIRIDPEKTFVYSSETRAKGTYHDLLTSRKPLLEYLDIIDSNPKNVIFPNKLCGNILTYKKQIFPSNYNCFYPFEDYLPIERMAEVVVNTPHIPKEWFVGCYLYKPTSNSSGTAGSKEPVCLEDKNMNMGAKGGSTEGGRRKTYKKKKTHRKKQHRKMKKTRRI